MSEVPFFVNNSVIATIDGIGFTMSNGSQQIKGIHTLKVIALDEEGKELESFNTTDLNLHITVNASKKAKIKSISTANGNVSLIGYGKVESINTTNGNISVDKIEGNVRNLQSVNGNFQIHANNVINATTVNGNIIKK